MATRNPPRGKSATTALHALKMIDALRGGPMTTAELCATMFFTSSGVRNYIRLLQKAGIVTFTKQEPKNPTLIVRLVDDDAQIAAYCAELDLHIPRALSVIERQQQRMLDLSSAHAVNRVHVLADDEPVKHRRHPATQLQRDPLVALLFGASRGAA